MLGLQDDKWSQRASEEKLRRILYVRHARRSKSGQTTSDENDVRTLGLEHLSEFLPHSVGLCYWICHDGPCVIGLATWTAGMWFVSAQYECGRKEGADEGRKERRGRAFLRRGGRVTVMVMKGSLGMVWYRILRTSSRKAHARSACSLM